MNIVYGLFSSVAHEDVSYDLALPIFGASVEESLAEFFKAGDKITCNCEDEKNCGGKTAFRTLRIRKV